MPDNHLATGRRLTSIACGGTMTGYANALMQDARIRQLAVIAIDAALAAISLFAAVSLRISGPLESDIANGLWIGIPIFTLIALGIFQSTGLYRRVWRYSSLTDIFIIVQAVTLSICLLLVTLLVIGRLGWMPRSVPVIQWMLLIVTMGGARMVRRMYCEYRRVENHRQPAAPAGQTIRRPSLLVGPFDRVETVLRLLETSPEAEFQPVGILDDSGAHIRMKVRGVPVLGAVDALDDVVKEMDARGERPSCLILADPSVKLRGAGMLRLVTQAESLGLKVASLPKLAEFDQGQVGELDLRYIDMTELLGRPQAVMDGDTVSRAITGRRVLVTGAGGTIGSELVRQIASLRPSQLVLLDSCEFNLYSIDLELQENHPEIVRAAVLCSIRQRAAVMQSFAEHKPEIVFHAAALKHVPLVEQHPCAGVQTNVIGTRNVADACREHGVQAMVQVSTDKAVNPVGLMGATKRLGELYCQALDLEGQDEPQAARFLTVRFGNVIGSSGSLIPLFQRQLRRGEALTVTHPDIQRYFMTVHEAVQLILQSTASALTGQTRRGRIFVLDMGDPVKIMDIACRMIRLAGLEPERDIRIDIIGLRPGEKLYEELFDERERQLPSTIPGIKEAEPNPVPLETLNDAFDELARATAANDASKTRALVRRLIDRERPVEPETVQFSRHRRPQQADTASHAA